MTDKGAMSNDRQWGNQQRQTDNGAISNDKQTTGQSAVTDKGADRQKGQSATTDLQMVSRKGFVQH